MGALAEASASDEAAYYAGRAVLPEKETILSKLVSCVLYSVGSEVPRVSRSRRLHCVLTAVRCAIDALGQCDQRGFR